MSKIDSIIFDLDGTLWSSAKAISEAWGLVLQKHEDIEKKEVTEEEKAKDGCSSTTGMLPVDFFCYKGKQILENSI